MAYKSKNFNKFVATAATATLVATAMAPIASAATDVPANTKYASAVEFLASKGVKGFADGTFRPHVNITRTDAAVMLVNVLGLDIESAPASGFTDVPPRAVKHVNALKEAGITVGAGGGKFNAHANITRGELAVWLQKGFELTSESNSVPFKDVAGQYTKAVAALVENGVTFGKSATTFGTHANATRGEFALFLQRANDAIQISKEPIVTGVSAINGTVTFTLTEAVEEVSVEDFKVTQSINGGEATAVTPLKAELAEDGKTVTLTVAEVAQTDTEQSVVYTVNNVAAEAFTVEAEANRQVPEYEVKSNEVVLTNADENILNTLFDGTVLDFGTTGVTVTDVDFTSDNEDIIADNDAVKEGTVAINTKYSGQTSIYVDTVTVNVNDTNETFVLELNDLQVDVTIVGSDSINHQVESGTTVALENILEDILNNITSDISNININIPTDATVTWETGAQHGSTPLIPEGATVKTVTLSGGGTFKATGDGVGPIRAANEGGKLVFKNMTIIDESESYAENAWEFGYLEFGGEVEFINSNFKNAAMFIGDKVSFTGCTFNSNKENEYAVWIDNGIASFDNCTFEGSRGLKIHEAYGSDVTSVTVDNSRFGPLSLKPGVAIGDLDGTTEVTIKNSIFEKTQPGDQSNYIYESDTAVDTFKFSEENNNVIK